MKYLIILLTAMMIAVIGHSQTYRSNAFYCSFGMGSRSVLGTMIKNDISDESELTGQTGPFNFQCEYGWKKHVGIGLHIAYEYTSLAYHPSYSNNSGNLMYGSFENWNTLIRFNYHPFNADKIDPYWGMGLGTRFQVVHGMNKEDIPMTYGGSLPELFTVVCVFGMRYYLSPAFGIYSEFGLAKSPIQLGITYSPGNAMKQ